MKLNLEKYWYYAIVGAKNEDMMYDFDALVKELQTRKSIPDIYVYNSGSMSFKKTHPQFKIRQHKANIYEWIVNELFYGIGTFNTKKEYEYVKKLFAPKLKHI